MQDKKRTVSLKTNAKDLGTVLNLLGVKEEVNVEVVVSVEDNKNTYKILNAPAVLDWDFSEEKEELTDFVINCERRQETDQPEKDDEYEKRCKEREEELKRKVDLIINNPRQYLKDCLGIPGVDEMTDEEVQKILWATYQTPVAKEEVKKEEEEDDKFYFPNHSIIDDTAGLVKVIESVWIASQIAPGVRFGTKLFGGNFRKAWNNITIEENTKTDLNHSTTRAMMKLLVDVFYNSPILEDEIATAYYDTLERIKENFNSLKSAETLNQVMNILYRHENKKI